MVKFSKKYQTSLFTEPVNTDRFIGGEKTQLHGFVKIFFFFFPSKHNLHLLQALEVLGENILRGDTGLSYLEV